MKKIHINLKRFDILKEKGGLCAHKDAILWIQNSIQQIIDLGWGSHSHVELTIFVPDILLSMAEMQRRRNSAASIKSLHIGTQSCHFLDVSHKGNFGAFTSHMLASGQTALGSQASIIGHCEERLGLMQILSRVVPQNDTLSIVVSDIISEKARCALEQGMKVTLCLGETAHERGEGNVEKQLLRAKNVIASQITASLPDMPPSVLLEKMTLAYEPVWAIGPGKTPPDANEIAQIVSHIKDISHSLIGHALPVIYGGGLKVENAQSIARIPVLDGGLIALTQFSMPPAFCPEELHNILTLYCQS